MNRGGRCHATELASHDNEYWRRERDSNPRWSYKPHTPLAGERLQPLGHLSRCKKLIFCANKVKPKTQKPPEGRFQFGHTILRLWLNSQKIAVNRSKKKVTTSWQGNPSARKDCHQRNAHLRSLQGPHLRPARA